MLVANLLRRLDSGRILGGIDTIRLGRTKLFPFAAAAHSLRQRYSSSRLSAPGSRPGLRIFSSIKRMDIPEMINNIYLL